MTEQTETKDASDTDGLIRHEDYVEWGVSPGKGSIRTMGRKDIIRKQPKESQK